MNFKHYYYLEERVLGNKFFLFLREPLEEVVDMTRVYGRGNLLPLRPKYSYDLYLKNIGTWSAHDPRNNYIYQITRPLNFFENYERRDWVYLWEGGYVTEGGRKFFGIDNISTSEEFADWAMGYFFGKGGSMGDVLVLASDDVKMFNSEPNSKWLSKWDGVASKRRLSNPLVDGYYTWWPKVENEWKLIDGNVMRFEKSADVDFEMPEWVVKAIDYYIEEAGRRFDKAAKAWCIEKCPKRNKRIYRGTGQGWPTWDYDELTLDVVNKKLKRRFGITLDECQIGQKIKVSRGKASSWSTTPQIAREFTSGMADRSINFLIAADVRAEQVIIDFTELPFELKKHFKYNNQNEVLVDKPVRGTINHMWIRDKFELVLNRFGYTFIKQKGIVRR